MANADDVSDIGGRQRRVNRRSPRARSNLNIRLAGNLWHWQSVHVRVRMMRIRSSGAKVSYHIISIDRNGRNIARFRQKRLHQTISSMLFDVQSAAGGWKPAGQ